MRKFGIFLLLVGFGRVLVEKCSLSLVLRADQRWSSVGDFVHLNGAHLNAFTACGSAASVPAAAAAAADSSVADTSPSDRASASQPALPTAPDVSWVRGTGVVAQLLSVFESPAHEARALVSLLFTGKVGPPLSSLFALLSDFTNRILLSAVMRSPWTPTD
jgi:hypothetical protein